MPKLVVGLGNPGQEYVGNRHNVGRMVVEGLARELATKLSPSHPKARLAQVKLSGNDTIVAATNDYMNRCGFGVSALCGHFNVSPGELLVVHDDLDLERSQVRIKKGGGSGGHNGLKSIIEVLGSEDFLRVRMGIGRPPGRMAPAEFVLTDFNAIEWAEMEFCYIDAIAAIRLIFSDGVEAAMNKFNRKSEPGSRGTSAGGSCD